MASGGARGHSGPPPNPNAARRERGTDGDWTVLPARREGPTPEWPLIDQTAREAELWASEWVRPQAAAWESNGQEIEVALYVRRLAEVELPSAPTSLGTLVKQMQESLGLSEPGRLRNRWKIAEDETAKKRHEQADDDGEDVRDRFTVVTDGTAG